MCSLILKLIYTHLNHKPLDESEYIERLETSRETK